MIMSIYNSVKNPVKQIFYNSYLNRLERKVERNGKLPQHIGLILDGNRRFAKQLGIPVRQGHAMGASKVREVVNWSNKHGIKYLTIWVFSSENWKRSPKEVKELLELFMSKAEELLTNGEKESDKIKLKFIGDKTKFPKKLVQKLDELEDKTKYIDGMQLNVAIGYGGRSEIVDAVKTLVAKSKTKTREKLIETITDENISKHVYNPDIPGPDFIIRTSGEVRLSGFMLWQSAYSEFYFTDVFWPAFRQIDFLRAIREFQLRNRRFGK